MHWWRSDRARRWSTWKASFNPPKHRPTERELPAVDADGATDTAADAPLALLAATVRAAAAAVRGGAGEPPTQLKLERTKHQDQGDYSTNAALLLAPVLDAPPRVIAERIGDEIASLLGEDLERADVAGPGFLNLVLSSAWYRRSLALVLQAGERFGAGGVEGPVRIIIEFVSANPTGPLVAAG